MKLIVTFFIDLMCMKCSLHHVAECLRINKDHKKYDEYIFGNSETMVKQVSYFTILYLYFGQKWLAQIDFKQ